MIGFYLIFIFLSAVIDAEHIEKKQYIYDHTSRWLLRLLITIIATSSFLEFLAFGLFFTATFDKILNMALKRPLWHLGTVSYWDKFWKNKIILYKICTIAAMIASILILTK